jgi:hypothetical protein
LSGAQAGAMFVNSEGPAIGGRLSLQTEFEGVGRSPAAFMGSLAGYGTVTLEQGLLAGLNPGVFDAISRAVELGIPIDGNRIREFVSGVLDSSKVPVPRATASVSISAGQSHFNDIVIQATGADIQAIAGINLTNATVDALLTLSGPPAVTLPGKLQPAVLIALKGPVMAPQRTVDTSLLTRWLTLLTVEQHSKQIDAMERAAREMKSAEPPKPAEPAPDRQPPAPSSVTGETLSVTGETKPIAGPPGSSSGPAPAAAQAPALPAPVEVPAAPKPSAVPSAVPRTESAVPPSATGQPPALVGAQN